jgi:PAS domain S-box-containing protein
MCGWAGWHSEIMISVLYVDDEQFLLEIAKVFLESQHEFNVAIVPSAMEALERLSTVSYDLILSDYQMPDMDGICFLKEVRSKFGNIPFILFTGKGREEVVIEAINNGADFYVQKGGDPRSQFAELAHKIRIAVERRKAVDALRDSEQRLADIINFLPDATFAINAHGVVIAWNKAIEKMTSIPAAEMLGKGNYEYAIPFYHERRPILIDIVLNCDQTAAARYPFIKKDGKNLFSEITIPHFHNGDGASLWFTASPLYDSKGSTVGAIESIREITERKVAEETLRQSEALYRNVVEIQSEFISRFTPSGIHIFANDAYLRHFNMIREELIGHRFFPDIPCEDREMVTNHFKTLTPDNPVATIIHRVILPDGSLHWHRWSDRAIFNETGLLTEYQSVGRDVTEMKQTEEMLREREAELRSMLDATPVGVVLLINRVFQKVNRSLCTMTGYSEEEMIGKSTCMLFPDDESYFRVGRELYRKMETEGLGTMQSELRKKDGSIIDVMLTLSPFDPYNLSDGVTATVMDISRSKQAEEALRKSEELHKKLVETVPDIVIRTDLEGKIVFINENGPKKYGFSGACDFLGKSILSLIAPGDLPKAIEYTRLMFERQLGPIEYDIIINDDNRLSFEVNGDVLRHPNGVPYGMVYICRDNTDRKREVGAMRMMNKKLAMLSSITRHDIVNKLTVFSGYNTLLKKKVTDAKVIELLIKQDNAAETIRRHIEFTREYENLGVKAPEWKSVSDTIRKAVSRLDSGAITIINDTEGLAVFADDMLEKVFYNLTENAVRHGKKISEIRFWYEKSGDNLVIICQDNGIGIHSGDKDKIFEEGFGKNTGIGMFISKEILDITNMTISETGIYGEGARFEIVVPKGVYRLAAGFLAGDLSADQLSART